MAKKDIEDEQPVKDMEELVEYTAPYDPTGEKADMIVGVNGEIIRIKMGSTVKIKRKFLEAIQNAQRQEFEAMKARERMKKGGQSPIANM